MPEFLTSALIIFVLRMVGVTFATLRIFMVVRGGKFFAWIFGFFQALTYVISIGWVISDFGNWTKILGYATGFATGVVIGMVIENRLAIGYTNLQIVSPHRGLETAQGLRDQGYAVTEVSAQGKDGEVDVLYCSVLRKYEAEINATITRLDPDAFIIAKNVYRIQHGFWQQSFD
jgi:uncharacterized protein YebE (UPF0316 family)